MLDITDPKFIAGMAALLGVLFVYAFMVPRRNEKWDPRINEEASKNPLIRGTFGFTSSMYSSLPASSARRVPSPRLEALLQASGNPWGVTAEEFITLRWGTAALGFIVGSVLWFALSFIMPSPWILFAAGATMIGYAFPTLVYRDQAKRRDLDFKRQMPDALDLIIISLSGGLTFNQALRESIPNMSDGIMKEEFKYVISSLDSGKNLSSSLEQFANRAPNQGIRTFVQSLREANELNVPLIDVLESRAAASREEHSALIRSRIAQVDSKMAAALAVPIIFSVLIVAGAPSAIQAFNGLS